MLPGQPDQLGRTAAHLGGVDPELLAGARQGTDLVQDRLVGLDRHARRLQVLRRCLRNLWQ